MSMKSPRLTRREQRQAQGVTLADIPAEIPQDVKVQALELLKSRDYIVYIGNPRVPRSPKWMHNQWLVVQLGSGREGPELLTQWATHYYDFRKAYDAWQ